MTRPFTRRGRERRAALAADFPDTGESVTEILDRVRPASYDARTIPFTGASGTGLPDNTEPLALKRIRDAGRRAWDIQQAQQHGTGLSDDIIAAIWNITAVALKETGRDTQPFAALRTPGQQPEPPVLAAVPVTEPAVIGDSLRLPVIWCEAAACIAWRHDPESAGERDARARAITAGWRPDAFGRLTCPDCQQRDPMFRVSHPIAWNHKQVTRRWYQDGENLPGEAKNQLAATAEYGRRLRLENPALARDVHDAATRYRHAPQAGAR